MAKQVLIIEDDDAVAKAVGELCSGLGEVAVVTAKTGAAGLEQFNKQAFDLVLLDILLPGGMDGYKVAEAMREKAGNKLPIVVMSGFLKDPKAQRDLQARFAVKAFLLKPLKPDDVRAAVASALGFEERISGQGAAPGASAVEGPAKTEGFVADLRQLPVATLFGELFRRKAEGVLDLTRGQTKKRFYLQRGFFRYATSNVRAETLSGLLAGRGIPEAKIAEAMAKAKQEGLQITEALVELRVIAERDVPALLAAQTEEVAQTALSWPDGSASFKPAAVDSGPEGRANPVMSVLKGLKRLSNPAAARAALEPQRTAVLERTPEFERELFAIRGLFSGEGISPAVNGKLSVGELLQRAKDIDLVLLQGLMACGLAKVRGAPAVELGSGARPGTEPGTPAFVPQARPGTTGASVARRHTAEEQEARAGILAESKRVTAATTHYQVLGVAPSADAAAIKSAYFRMARSFHVDAFSGLELGDATAALEEIFKRATEANRVLSSPEERTSYDLLLDNQAKGLPTSVDAIMQAESTFHRGESARKAGRLKDAEKLFREAVGQNAGEPTFLFGLASLIHQLYGKASSAEALELLDKGLRIKQDSLPAMLLRGQLLLEAGDSKQALEIARKIVGIQAGYPGAMDLLKLAKAGGSGEAEKGGTGGLFGKLFGGKGK